MRKRTKQAASLLLAAALTLSLAAPAGASEALGTELRDRTVQVAQGVTVTNQSLWSATFSDLRTENYITYTPISGGLVTPVVSYGESVSSLSTLKSMAAQLEQQGLRVVGGVNASFFNSNGTPIGLLVTNGLIQSDGADYYAVGFFSDGSVRIGAPKVTTTAAWTTHDTVTVDEAGNEVVLPGGPMRITLSGINKIREDGGYYLYTDSFGTATKNTVSGTDVVLRPLEIGDPFSGMVTRPAGLSLGTDVACEVLGLRDSAVDGSIPAGCFVLSMNANSDPNQLALLSALQVGDVVTLSAVCDDPSWNEAVHVVSGMYQLVKGGVVTSGLSNTRNPYTAVGVRADGSMVLYTIDGRQSGYSVGATYNQVAQRMIELGCVDVVAMDGGGSTSVGTTLPDQSAFAPGNRPSDGSFRSVSTCIFLVEPANGGSGMPGSYYVSASNDLVLAGSSVKLSVTALDSACYPTYWSGGQLFWQAEQGDVTMDMDGTWRYTARFGELNQFDTVTVTDGGLFGTVKLKVINQLTGLTVRNEGTGKAISSLAVSPDDVVDLSAAGIYYNMTVASTDTDYTWTVDPAVGTVDETGHFVAGNRNASGQLTVTGGGKTVNIPVTVTGGDPFADTDGHWAKDYITQLYQLGVTKGVTDSEGVVRFYPQQNISRGELLTMVVRMLGVDVNQYAGVELPFADAGSLNAWMVPYVKAAYALGIFKGSGHGGVSYADADVNITREAAMTIIGRTMSYTKTADLSAFTDGGAVSGWASEYVQTLVAMGVVGGSGGMLNPGANVTRAEMAKIIVATLALPEQNPSPDPSQDPSGEPSGDPSGEPSPEPSGDPTQEPSPEPSGDPSPEPAPEPSGEPSGEPSQGASNASLRLSVTDITISDAFPSPVTIRTEGGTGTVTWSSSDSKVATVDANGKVTGVGTGACTVTATDSAGNTASCIVRCALTNH